jgi:nitrate/nitrite-specific signal transduction histidine kinase
LELLVQERTGELEKANKALLTEIRYTNILHTLSTRYIKGSDSHSLYQEIVEAVIAITNADNGNIQLLDVSTGKLIIVATRVLIFPF